MCPLLPQSTTELEIHRMTCPGCDRKVDDSALWCDNCGRILNVLATQEIDCDDHSNPICGLCALCARPLCERCAVLRDGRIFCSDPDHPIIFEQCTLVYVAASEFESDLILRNNPDGNLEFRAFPFLNHPALELDGRLAGVRLFVKKEKYVQAREYLQSLELALWRS